MQHIFKDVDGTTYLLWKTDDNSVGSKTTRLWGQQIAIKSGSVSLLGTRQQLMDSSGLWWVQSFIAGGSLIEGPELIHRGDYYYLFCERCLLLLCFMWRKSGGEFCRSFSAAPHVFAT